MSNIHENLQKILHAVWGKDVRQAIHDAIHDCYEDGSAGSTDLIAREEIEELEATKATRIELAEETADRLAEIAVERGRIDNLVTSGTGVTNATKRTETTLFSASVPCFGNVSGNSGHFNLEDDIDNYDYIKIRYNAFGRTGIVDCKPADISASGTLGSSVFHWSEIQPNWETTSLDNPRTVFRHMDFSASNISSGNTYRLSIDAVVFGWNGDATSNGKISDSFAISWDSSKSLYVASGFAGGIYSVIGVKYTDAGVDKDIELTDIRTGVDGTVYQTAGGAVRGQIEDITNRLNGVESNFDDEYDSTATYAVGDRCVHEGVWYECNTAISTAEDWTEAHWDKVSLADITDQVAQNTAGIAENASEVQSLKEDLNVYTDTTAKPNKFNKTDLIDGYYFASNGSIVAASNWAYSPTYGEITAETVYYGKYLNNSVWALGLLAICWYDADKQFISQMYNLASFTAPQNAKYVRISYNKGACNDSLVFADFQATKAYEYGWNYALKGAVEIPAITAANRLRNKVLCCAGDSITYGADMDADGITQVSDITMYQCDNAGDFSVVTSDYRKTWGYQIAERNAMTFYNAGVSGSTMQGEGGINGFSLENGRYAKLPDHIDYLVIWFGYNDAAYGTLGTIDDDTNASYYGGYNVVLPYLINKYPYAKIALVVPYGVGYQRRQAVRLLANKWGVAVWDNFGAGTPLYYEKEPSVGVLDSIATANRAKFQASGAHPNYRGHTQLADMIEDFLRSI